MEVHMESSGEISFAARYGFTDFHSFKSYVGFVRGCAPNLFPVYDWIPPDEQMNLERAFFGLRSGFDLSTKEKGELPVFSKCRELVEEAYGLYRAGQPREGQAKLGEISELLKKIPSQ
jgi:hypothetical protein